MKRDVLRFRSTRLSQGVGVGRFSTTKSAGNPFLVPCDNDCGRLGGMAIST